MSERTRPLFCFSPGDQTFVSPPIPDNEFRYGFLCADLLRIDYIIGSRYVAWKMARKPASMARVRGGPGFLDRGLSYRPA